MNDESMVNPRWGKKDASLSLARAYSHARVGRYEVQVVDLEQVIAGIGAVPCWRLPGDFAAIQRQ